MGTDGLEILEHLIIYHTNNQNNLKIRIIFYKFGKHLEYKWKNLAKSSQKKEDTFKNYSIASRGF